LPQDLIFNDIFIKFDFVCGSVPNAAGEPTALPQTP